MKHQVSLKLVVVVAFLSLAVVLVLGYSLLSSHFFHKGLESGAARNMEEITSSYVQSVPYESRNQLNTFSGFSIGRTWEQLPLEIREAFDNVPPSAQIPFKVQGEHSKRFGPPDSMAFIFLYIDKNSHENLFVGRRTYRDPAPSLLGKNAAEGRRMLFLLSGAIAGIVAVTVLLLLRHVAKPAAALEQWARSLGPNNLNQPPPDFSYPELNNMAALVRSSLSSVQESLDREHRFLRYASHELRTPITIIRNNIELFPMIEKLKGPKRLAQQEKVIERIDRASLNMQHLTETLLWLSRENCEKLSSKPLELHKQIEHLTEEMMYLIDRKDIELDIDTSSCTVSLPEIPTQIVLGNLIRNAFQHSWEGRVTIYQRGSRVEISNTLTAGDKEQKDLGFGLGLQLTAQLAEKLDWLYTDESEHDTHKVSIVFDNNELNKG